MTGIKKNSIIGFKMQEISKNEICISGHLVWRLKNIWIKRIIKSLQSRLVQIPIREKKKWTARRIIEVPLILFSILFISFIKGNDEMKSHCSSDKITTKIKW